MQQLLFVCLKNQWEYYLAYLFYLQSAILITMLENKPLRWVLGGFTLIGVSYLSYRLWQHYFSKCQASKRKASEISQDEQRLHTLASNYSQFYFDKEFEIQNIVSKLSEKGPTIEDVYLLSPAILVDEYLKYTKEIRKRRRLIRKVNEDQYVGLIRNYQFQIRELLQRGREELLQQCGQSMDDLERMEKGFQIFDNLQDLRKKAMRALQEKSYPPARLRRVPKSKLRRIMEQEINFISNRMYERLKTKLQLADQLNITQEEIYRIITTLIDDIIYEKYGYEREQIEKQLSELPNLEKDLKKWRNTLLIEIGELNLDSLESPEVSQNSEYNNKGSLSANTQILDESREDD